MKRIALLLALLACDGLTVRPSFSQDIIEALGLEGKSVTSVSANSGILAVGTDRHGVYWQPAHAVSSTGWIPAGLDTLSVQTVYPHKSGPIGWAISAGVVPDKTGDPFVYCSYMGGAFEARSHGISDSLTAGVVDMDGFPDPTICGETYAAGGRALYRRYFVDTTWTPIYTTTHDGDIQTVRVRSEYPGVVLAGGAEGFSGFMLIKSTDYGESWDNISPPTTVVSVDFSGSKAETVFAAGSSAVFRSRDGGGSWEMVWDGPGAYRISEIAYDPETGIVYVAGRTAGNDGGGVLIISADDGTSWRPILLSVGPIVDLALSGDWLYLATAQDGIFRSRHVVLDREDDAGHSASEAIQLHKNYPDPFSTATTISYEFRRPAEARLTVFDIMGREVTVLASAPQRAGQYKLQFDAVGLASGLYFYRLVAGNFVETKTMVVVQ